ncbi:MAG: arsenosugar biosynthesis radical SAM protein ArsS [bacterium]|nr:arsenosugar biosynthesis radical SAM protein ArsS [bacterium]
MMVKSLKFRHSILSDSAEQINILKKFDESSFESYVKKSGFEKFLSRKIEIFQINMGKMCNQTCKHCHVDAGPDRKEIMTKETMMQCLEALENSDIQTVDLTGGAPEMNPDFKWFVEEIKKLNRHIIVRCNLTIILANPKFHYLPKFFSENRIEVVSSLPYYQKSNTDRQRGDGVFESSIKALKLLNESGYGKENSGLILNLVYNPTGAFLPANQSSLEKDFKTELFSKHGIVFNNLFTITNMPISRFLEYLLDSGNFEYYMEKLISSFNPSSVPNVMCRNTISIGWDGYLYDCDFNQMLDIKVNHSSPDHIKDFNTESLNSREIMTGNHCFGCTAGTGSSCGGAVV